MQIDDLATDLTDGVKLIVLLEVLSQKPFGKYNKKAKIHAQRMENIDMALDFITRKEKVRLVNIGEFLILCEHVCILSPTFGSLNSRFPQRR